MASVDSLAASDEVLGSICNACKFDEKEEGTRFCIECREYLCTTCADKQRRFKNSQICKMFIQQRSNSIVWPELVFITIFFFFFFFLSVSWPTGVQLLVFFCSSVPVVLFDTPGISRCRSQHISVESSSLLHHSIYLWFICFTWWSIDELENLHADRITVCFEPW